MTTNDEQYVPTEGQVREQYVGDHRAAYAPEFAAEFDRFLARVRRDAAREVLNGLARDLAAAGGDAEAGEVRDYRDTHYPEGTP